MVRSGGFEPPTTWFVARYSIQLSYERTSWGAYYRVDDKTVNDLNTHLWAKQKERGGERGIRTLDRV
jgi:hypothetical protein